MEAVVDVLGHLRDRDRNLKPRTAQSVVQLHYFGPAAVVALADYRLGRIQEVLYAATFPEEFGVHANAEVDPDSLARSPFPGSESACFCKYRESSCSRYTTTCHSDFSAKAAPDCSLDPLRSPWKKPRRSTTKAYPRNKG